MSDEDYEVGYGRPPKRTQFKKGHSGNPKGRPKGSNNLSTDVKKVLNEKITYTEAGRKTTGSTQLISLKTLRAKALSGDVRALDKLIGLGAQYNDDDVVTTGEGLGATDKEVLDNYQKRQDLRNARGGQSNDRGDHDQRQVGEELKYDNSTDVDGTKECASEASNGNEGGDDFGWLDD